jgi:hypothetical protein
MTDEDELMMAIPMFELSPDIPQKYREEFEEYKTFISRLMALGNIERFDCIWFKTAFQLAQDYIDMGLYEQALRVMAEVMMDMQLSRSYGGFYTLYGKRGIERTESIQKISDSAASHSRKFWDRLRLKRKEENKSSMQPVGMEGR